MVPLKVFCLGFSDWVVSLAQVFGSMTIVTNTTSPMKKLACGTHQIKNLLSHVDLSDTVLT